MEVVPPFGFPCTLEPTLLGVAYMKRSTRERIRSSRDHERSSTARTVSAPGGIFGMGSGTPSVVASLLERLSSVYIARQTYVHCELAFMKKDQANNCIAFGVFTETGVFCKERTFSNPDYEWLFLSVRPDQAAAIYRFCMLKVKIDGSTGGDFDRWGAFRSCFWPVSAHERKGWWCISFVVRALQEGGILLCYIPEAMDVDDTVELLQRHPKKTNHFSPLDMQRLDRGEFSQYLFETPPPPPSPKSSSLPPGIV